jgi:hypothetical protein
VQDRDQLRSDAIAGQLPDLRPAERLGGLLVEQADPSEVLEAALKVPAVLRGELEGGRAEGRRNALDQVPGRQHLQGLGQEGAGAERSIEDMTADADARSLQELPGGSE